MRYIDSFGDGSMFWATQWEVWVDPSSRVARSRRSIQWVQQSSSVWLARFRLEGSTGHFSHWGPSCMRVGIHSWRRTCLSGDATSLSEDIVTVERMRRGGEVR